MPFTWVCFPPIISMADSNPTPTHLKVASHNVQGLNSPIKWRKAFHNYHSRHIEILLLQETHFPKSYTPSFLHQNYPTFFLANPDVKKRGVSVCISIWTPFTHSHTNKDKEGRYILVKGHINGELYKFISYYAPNRGQASFFSSMLSALSPYLEGRVIVGGDSNIAFDCLLDKSRLGPPSTEAPKQSLRIAWLLHSLGLIDSWREHNPSTKNYTHFSAPHKTYARIDHIFIHSSDIHPTSGATIWAIPWSDHSLITIQIEGSVTPVGPPSVAPQWIPPFQPSTLHPDWKRYQGIFLLERFGGDLPELIMGGTQGSTKGQIHPASFLV